MNPFPFSIKILICKMLMNLHVNFVVKLNVALPPVQMLNLIVIYLDVFDFIVKIRFLSVYFLSLKMYPTVTLNLTFSRNFYHGANSAISFQINFQ